MQTIPLSIYAEVEHNYLLATVWEISSSLSIHLRNQGKILHYFIPFFVQY